MRRSVTTVHFAGGLGRFATAVFGPPSWSENHVKCQALAAGDPCRRPRK